VRAQFQVIHNFLSINELESFIKKVLEPINDEVYKAHNYFEYNKFSNPFSFNIEYSKSGNNCTLTGVYLDYSEYMDNQGEYYCNVIAGFEQGEGYIFDELNCYIEKFITSLKQNDKVLGVVKFEDCNQKLAYWQLFKYIYEIEMQLREIISFLLFGESKNNNIVDTIKEKLVFRHSVDKEVLNRNCENEIFSLDFTHYKKILETYPQLFTKSIVEDVDTVRGFRNSLMHNKGFTNISPENFWNAQERLVKFISDFWNANRLMTTIKME